MHFLRYRTSLHIFLPLVVFVSILGISIVALSYYNTGFYRPVPGGVQIIIGDYRGTTGYVVEDSITGTRYLLVAYHVAYKGGSLDVYQPNTSSDYYFIGSIVRHSTEADAALVKANDELSVSFDPRVRLPDGTYASFSSILSWDSIDDYMNNIAKFMGVVSGLTTVHIIGKYSEYYYVDPDTGTTWNYKYLVVFTPSATNGDSGAPLWILSWGGNLLVGHVVLKLSENTAAAVSVSAVSRYLGVVPVTGG